MHAINSRSRLDQANMDIQFVSENSLALAYITKAEKSHMQQMFDGIDNDQSLFSRLFSFGVCSLRSRECGMYEACDIFLGDICIKNPILYNGFL